MSEDYDHDLEAATRSAIVRRKWESAQKVWLKTEIDTARMALIVLLSRDQQLHRALESVSRRPRRILQRYRADTPLARIQELTIQRSMKAKHPPPDDGAEIEARSRRYGTNYSSSNLGIASFGAEDGVVFAGQNGNGSIRTLRTAFDDPEVWAQGFVPNAIYYRPSVEHPIFAGFPVGERIELIVNSPNQQFEQFVGYSGETIAGVESATAALGGGVGYRFASSGSVHLLLGSLGVSSFGSPTARWTDNARRIYLNGVEWALDASQAEVLGTVSSGGEPVAGARVTAVERGAAAVGH